MRPPTTLGVIGLGAIGGSVARQAKAAGIPRVLGWSPDAAERDAARQAGALDETPGSPAEVARVVDLLILAAPPVANLELLEAVHAILPAQALITDVGSVKRAIVDRAEQLGIGARFAGSHPLAGTHDHGFKASRPDLFRNAIVYITPTRGPAGERAAGSISDFWRSVCGARPVLMDALAHDKEIAVTSHVPQVIASLLGHYLARFAGSGMVVGPGARDTTRLAASEPGLWTEILLMNRDVLLPALRTLEEPLGELERALERGEAEQVKRWLERAAEWRRGLDAQ